LHYNREAVRLYAQDGIKLNEVTRLPDPPKTTAYIFQLYDELSAQGRPQSMNGIAAIPWSEIMPWCALRGFRPNRFEREALILIDRAFVSVMSDRMARNAKKAA